MQTTVPALPEILSILGKSRIHAYCYVYGDVQKMIWTRLREVFPASVIAPGTAATQVDLVIDLPELTAHLIFDKKAIADEVREVSRPTTTYVIDGEEI